MYSFECVYTLSHLSSKKNRNEGPKPSRLVLNNFRLCIKVTHDGVLFYSYPILRKASQSYYDENWKNLFNRNSVIHYAFV